VPFQNIAAYVDSYDSGKYWHSTFRKVPAVATTAARWFDYSGTAGNPVPNYFASSPLTAATLEGDKGIYPGPNMVGDEKKYLRDLIVMSAGATNTTTTNANQPAILLDYLLYYPFIDMDAAGEEQLMDNTVTLPRYTDGIDVQMMMVVQATTIGGGQFTVKYIDENDVEQTTINLFCPTTASVNGELFGASAATTATMFPFLPLVGSGKGVKRVVSVTFSVANGGLAALVLVKPLWTIQLLEESRRTSTGTLESFGAAVEKEAITMTPRLVEVKNGAYLNFITNTLNGTVSGCPLVGMLETIWG
jgi:hypothetical protein